VFGGGSLRHVDSLPVGGIRVTNDIAVALRTPTAHAEEIKVKYACALAQLAHAEETIQVPSVGDRPPRRLARQTLAEVVQPRYEELFSLAQAELRRSGYESLVSAGIVLTGGAAKMEGVVDLAEEVFHMPVRLGTPQHVTGLSDVVSNQIHATGVGLLIYGSRQASHGAPRGVDAVGGVWDRVSNWFKGNF
jgi:cell division protein FtsA